MSTMRHAPKTLAMLALATAGAYAATLITAQPAAAMSIADLQAAGFSILSDGPNNGCITYSAAVPKTAWTQIGKDCDANFSDEVMNFYDSHLAAMKQYQASTKSTTAAVTITVTKTIYDAGSTATVTTTTPASTETITGPTTTIYDTTTQPGPTTTQWQTTTQATTIQAPPQTVTETQTETDIETQTETIAMISTLPGTTVTIRERDTTPHRATRRARAFRTG